MNALSRSGISSRSLHLQAITFQLLQILFTMRGKRGDGCGKQVHWVNFLERERGENTKWKLGWSLEAGVCDCEAQEMKV